MREAQYSFRMQVRLCLLTVACAIWASPLGAATAPAVSNLDQPSEGTILVGNNNLDLQVAASFRTGPSPSELTSVTLRGFGFGGASSFRVALYSGISSAGPSGIVATLSGNSSPGALASYTYTAAAPIDLTANTTYWLVASAPGPVNPSGFSWSATSSAREDADPLPGWGIGDEYWTTSTGNNGNITWLSQSNRVPQFSAQVNTRPATAPVITIQPTPVTPFSGNNVTLTAAAVGSPTPSFQWRKDGVAIQGAISTSLTLVAGANNAGSYSVVVTNSAGTVTSQDFVVARPTFSAGPASQKVLPGATVNFTATPSSAFPMSYQWQKDGVPIPASSAATLTVPNVQVFSVGNYSVVATNIAGSTTSPVATLSLILSDAGRLTNLSIRSTAGVGGQPLIVGVVVGGAGTTGTRPLLLRGVGPSLAGFGVTGFLVDPVLSVFSGATVVASNDNWGGDAQVASVGSQLGAFPLVGSTSRDAAIYNPTLNPGNYTIQIAGVGGTSGIALAEIYDPVPANLFFPTTPRLINVSARSQVGTDGNILIAGFSISGGASQKLLIRAVGPTLTGFGVSGALADPKLDIYQGSTILQSNDNWGDLGGVTIISAAAASVGAFPLGVGSRDAALLVSLFPGSYTVQVSGVGNTSGMALIEIYEVP